MAVAKPKLFLFAGQSNMAGVGDWSSLTAAERASVSNVRVFSADPNHAPPITQPPSFQYWLPPQGVFINYAQWSDTGLSWNATNPAQYATVNNFGPEFTTVRDLASGLGEHIYLAKYALGGTGLDASFATMGGGTWYFNATDPGLPAEYSQSLYHSMVSWANKALAAARQIEPETEFAGFFWLQGEADALLPNTANSYNNNLTIFIQHLRSDLGMAHLPVVIGRIADKATILIGAGTVRTAQATVAAATNNTVWVDTDGLAMDPTQLHYLDAGLKTIGQRGDGQFQGCAGTAIHSGTGGRRLLYGESDHLGLADCGQRDGLVQHHRLFSAQTEWLLPGMLSITRKHDKWCIRNMHVLRDMHIVLSISTQEWGVLRLRIRRNEIRGLS